MAFYTNEEFGALIGKDAKYINVQVGRNNIIRSGKLIDDTFDKNRIWLEKMRAKLGLGPKVEVVPAPAPVQVPSMPPISAPVDRSIPKEYIPEAPNSNTSSSVYEMEREKAQLSNEKIRQEIRVKRAQAEKLEGGLIPVEVVASLILLMSESMKIAYMESLETYTVVVSAQAKLDNDQVAKIKKHFTAIINDNLKKQVSAAKRGLKNIVAEYSESRGQGERKS
tara:strand:+ start:981 stop:1649 length:669 start_codon:yes stop_codon:yes gene_type:complete